MANLSVEEPYALMRARTGRWEPWAGNCPGPPGLFYAARPRRRHQPAAANISSTSVVGSGTAAFALTPVPLPEVWPKWARQTS